MNAQELAGSLNQTSYEFFIVKSMKASKYSKRTKEITNYNYDYGCIHIASTKSEAIEVFEKLNSGKSILEHYEIWHKNDGGQCCFL